MDHGCTYLCIWIRCGAMCLFLRGQRMQCMFGYMHGQNMCFPIYYAAQNLGPVYTTVEKSTGHEKKGISQLWLVENATLDRWVFTLGEENNGGELFSWMIKWHGRIRGGTFWSWASPASWGQTINSSSGEAQLNKKLIFKKIWSKKKLWHISTWPVKFPQQPLLAPKQKNIPSS